MDNKPSIVRLAFTSMEYKLSLGLLSTENQVIGQVSAAIETSYKLPIDTSDKIILFEIKTVMQAKENSPILFKAEILYEVSYSGDIEDMEDFIRNACLPMLYDDVLNRANVIISSVSIPKIEIHQ